MVLLHCENTVKITTGFWKTMQLHDEINKTMIQISQVFFLTAIPGTKVNRPAFEFFPCWKLVIVQACEHQAMLKCVLERYLFFGEIQSSISN